jgi:5-methylcytosine-specific restriction endonuclease McrA
MKRRKDHTPEPESRPRGFVRSARFEALRTMRRKQPELYISMSTGIKSQLELYCLWRRAHEARAKTEKRARIIAERGAFCACCGESIPAVLTLDHIRPRAEGGTSAADNLQVLCLGCNDAKGRQAFCPHEQIVRGLMFEHVA